MNQNRLEGHVSAVVAGIVPAVAMIVAFAAPQQAQAVPAFAAQTGMACTACHVGAFGPQLTPIGRAFKIGGYTQSGGSGWQAHVPFSIMGMTSFTHVGTNYPADQVPHHYNNNNNFSLDQISAFIAGRVSDHTGGFMQITYSDFDNTFVLDNTDLRPYTTTLQAFGNDLTVGLSINNNPTVQDPYNSTPAWGYPYYTNNLEISPGASTLLGGTLAGNVIGVTAYAWYNEHLYVEAGAYGAQSPWLSYRLGTAGGPASGNLMPYVRAAYEWDWGPNAAWAGGTMLHANINPGFGTGQDSYTDYGVDGGYQFISASGKHSVTVQGMFVHESQDIGATASANAPGSATKYGLNTLNLNAQYWYQNTYGAVISWFAGFGSANPILYQPASFSGFANNSPNYDGFSLEADWVPFGKDNSLWRSFANIKIGAQYTHYIDFNGGSPNYDGAGRNASGNDSFLLFLWTIF